ncbi:MAG: hypothetical protein V1772_08955, partial [Chloroflexota bacterium]
MGHGRIKASQLSGEDELERLRHAQVGSRAQAASEAPTPARERPPALRLAHTLGNQGMGRWLGRAPAVRRLSRREDEDLLGLPALGLRPQPPELGGAPAAETEAAPAPSLSQTLGLRPLPPELGGAPAAETGAAPTPSLSQRMGLRPLPPEMGGAPAAAAAEAETTPAAAP